MNSIALNTTMTAQQQIARALAEVFEGKSFRYWKTGKETIFVAKDLVEAAGGVWSGGTNFKTVVGEGSYTVSPLEINGISQNVLTCTAKIAVKWLTLSRLPASESLAEKVWDIVGRVIDGEQVNAPVAQITTDPRLNALEQYDKELEISERIWKRLGMKKIDRDVEAVQVGRRIEKRLLVSDLVPPSIANRAAKIERATKKLVEVASSGKHVKPVRLLAYLGYKESTYFAKYLNSALMDMGLQTYHPDRPAYYTPVGAGSAIAATDTIGGIKDVIIGWEPVRTSAALKEYFAKNPSKEPK